jgi:hypothetical protein
MPARWCRSGRSRPSATLPGRIVCRAITSSRLRKSRAMPRRAYRAAPRWRHHTVARGDPTRAPSRFQGGRPPRHHDLVGAGCAAATRPVRWSGDRREATSLQFRQSGNASWMAPPPGCGLYRRLREKFGGGGAGVRSIQGSRLATAGTLSTSTSCDIRAQADFRHSAKELNRTRGSAPRAGWWVLGSAVTGRERPV